MPKSIDWLYARKNCVTCQRTQAYLEAAGNPVKEAVNGLKIKYSPQEALKMLDGLDRFVAMKGKNVVVFDLKKDRPADDVLLKYLLGPSGNLRAPAIRLGRTLLIGFNEDAYHEYIGG
jgi:arsenate reductase-like glutaredoxin family protein